MIGLSGFNVSTTEKHESNDTDVTFNEYIDWLENLEFKELLLSGATPDSEELMKKENKEVIQQLINLSKEEQESFMIYLNNPEKIFEAIADESNEDVIIREYKAEIQEKTTTANSGYQTRNAGYYGDIVVNSIPMITVEIKGSYETFGTSVTKLLSKSSRVVSHKVKNAKFTRTVNTSKIVGGNKYRGDATWRVNNTATGANQGNIYAWVGGSHIGTTGGGAY